MRLFGKVYEVFSNEDADAKFFNSRFGSIDERLHALELLKVSVEAEQKRIRDITVAEATVILQDAAAAVEGIAQLATVITLHSLSTLSLETGSHQLVIDQAEWELVPQNAYVTLTPVADRTHRMSGYLSGYQPDTGTMDIDVIQVEGSGTHSQWLIGLAAPSTASGLSAGNVTFEAIEGLQTQTVQAALTVLHTASGGLAEALNNLATRVEALEGTVSRGPDTQSMAFAYFIGA